jgi:hypothetical protein
LTAPHDNAWQKRTDVQLDCTSLELERFADFLVKTRRGRRGEGATFRTANIPGEPNPLSRIIRRLNTHHAHGIYTTIVEECLIALKSFTAGFERRGIP